VPSEEAKITRLSCGVIGALAAAGAKAASVGCAGLRCVTRRILRARSDPALTRN
jgi:hypothetical protein